LADTSVTADRFLDSEPRGLLATSPSFELGLVKAHATLLEVLEPPKPRRRIVGRILWPVVITAVTVIAFAVSSAGSDTKQDLEYLNEIHGQAVQLSIGGESLSDVMSRLTRIDRTELVTVVDGIREDLAAGILFVEVAPPSDELVAVHSLYSQALVAWDRGVGGVASGLLTAADDPTNTAVIDIVANGLAELRAGDELYVVMVGELERSEVPDPVAPMPDVVMMPTQGELFSLSQAYVDAARSSRNTLALKPGLAISRLIPEPDWTVNPDEQVVVPNTDSIIFSVVITNSGNVVGLEETLNLTVTGGPEPFIREAVVESLKPGEQTTVAFDPVPVEGGRVYDVTATLIISGSDIDFDDNEVFVVFRVNEG